MVIIIHPGFVDWWQGSQIFVNLVTVESFSESFPLCNNIRMYREPFGWHQTEIICIKTLSVTHCRMRSLVQPIHTCSSSSIRLACSFLLMGILLLWTSFNLNYASKWNKNDRSKLLSSFLTFGLLNEFQLHDVWRLWPDSSSALSIAWVTYRPVDIQLWEKENWFPCLQSFPPTVDIRWCGSVDQKNSD